MAKEALSKGEKRLLIFSIVFVIVAVAIGYGFYSVNVNPVVNIPAPVFAMVRHGFACEYREMPCRSFSQLFPDLAKMRDLARTMLADGDVKCASGDWDGGTERFLDAIRLGNDCPRGGVLISMLVGAGIQSIGRSEAWPALDHISGAEARRAARRLEEMAARRVPYADVLQEEEWAWQVSLLELFNTPRWRTGGSVFGMMGGGTAGENSIAISFRLQIASKRTIMANFTRYMDALIANAKKPYPACTKSPPLPNDPFCRFILPIYNKVWIKVAVTRTENDQLMVSFALREYKADHSKYPANLNALVPAYLKAVPVDPFTSGGTLRYRVTGKSCTLYSVGPDGKDDGGTPSAAGQYSAPGAQASYVPTNSTGDIVAGVNIR